MAVISSSQVDTVKEGLVLDGNNGDSAKAAGKQDTDGKKYFSNLVY